MLDLNFEVNISEYLPALGAQLATFKSSMMAYKEGDFNLANGMWSAVLTNSYYLEKSTGQKIL